MPTRQDINRQIIVILVIFLGAAQLFGQQEQNRERPERGMQYKMNRDNVLHIKDLPYLKNSHERQCLDLLIPKNSGEKSLPVIVYVHGGAFRAGDKSSSVGKLIPFVASGDYAAATVNYRLSGDAVWPAQIHDCKAAIRWIRANANKYGLDSDRIGVWGSSAGGHLVSMLGTSSGAAVMDGGLGEYKDVSSHVSCVADFFGPTDFLQMDKAGSIQSHDAPDSPESELIGGAIQENKDKVATANPIRYITKDDPPFLIIHGTKDPLVPYNQSELFITALRKAKINCTMITVKDGGHGQGFGPETIKYTKQFFDHHLRGIESEWKDMTIEAVKVNNTRQ